jgi:hypothetical protein
MSFISADQVRKVRLKGAKPLLIDGLDLKLFVIKLSSDATFEAGAMQDEVTAGTKKPRDVALLMLANGVADETGNPIGPAAALELLQLLPVEELNAFMGVVKNELGKVKGDPGNSAASTASSSATV